MGRVCVQWPYVFSRNLLTEGLFEPKSLLNSSHTWHHTLIWPDSLVVANVCKLSLEVFLYQAPVLSTSPEGDFSISLPSHLMCRSIVEYTVWARKAGTALVLDCPWDCGSLQDGLRKRGTSVKILFVLLASSFILWFGAVCFRQACSGSTPNRTELWDNWYNPKLKVNLWVISRTANMTHGKRGLLLSLWCHSLCLTLCQ